MDHFRNLEITQFWSYDHQKKKNTYKVLGKIKLLIEYLKIFRIIEYLKIWNSVSNYKNFYIINILLNEEN